jgi:poly-gamma-glutamate synthesis protein (capsule biosynthesis protein)
MLIKSKKALIWTLFLFVLVFFSTSQLFNLVGNIDNRPVYQNSHPALTKAGIDGYLTVALVGDIMLDRGVEYSVKKNFLGDYEELFSKVKDQLLKYDFLFGNLEGPVSDKGEDVGGVFSFRMDPVVLPVLSGVGFKAFSLDNNHILNYGPKALADTKFRLRDNNLKYAGQEPFILGGVKVAILSFNQFANLDLEEMRQTISSAKLVSDLVIAYFHFGDEYQLVPNEYQKKVSKLAIDSGADLVMGAHPHVVQTLEQYKNTWIAYSLGNFIFDQNFSNETMQGGLLEALINPEEKIIEKVTLRKVMLNKFFQIESIE